MYETSEYSGRIRNTETGEIFFQDASVPQWAAFNEWRQTNSLGIVPYFPDEFIQMQQPYIDAIEEEYRIKLTNYLSQWIEAKEFGDIIEYPQSVINERLRLIAERDEKITQLGIDLSSYRQSKQTTNLK